MKTRLELQALKKEALIDLLIEQEHLSAAVQAKDNEIAQLKQRHAAELDSKITIAVGKTDKLVEALRVQLEAEKTNHTETQKAATTQIEHYEKRLNQLATINQENLSRYHNLLKTLEGTLDTHVEMHAFSVQITNSVLPKKRGVEE